MPPSAPPLSPLAYPPPASPQPPGYSAFPARRLPPLSPIPQRPSSPLPALPSPPEHSPFPGWTLTTHLAPSARPRASPTATTRVLRPPHPPPAIPDSPQAPHGKSKAERKREVEELLLRMRKQREATCAEPSWREPEGGDGEPQLWNCLQRYQREPALPTLKPKPGGNSPKRDDAPEDGETEGVTLFLAHANGFPKQIWQPVLRHLFALYAGVDEVWLWETANHGDSALVNAGKLGDTFDWADNARDVLQFLQFHRPLPGQAELPLHLPPHALESTPRRVVGVGHSLGGGTLTRAALARPSYFDALILVDPVIIADHIWTRRPAEIERYNALVRGALARRAVWGSREEAKLGFLKSPFFQAWDPAALDAYVEYGLCGLPPATSSPSGASPRAGVMLKQSPYDEASVFCEPRAQAESWYLLPLLPARIELRWIMNGRSAAEATGGEEATRYTVWRRPANSSNVRVREAGHLIPQEAPGRLAQEIAQVLLRRYGRDGRGGAGSKARL